MSVQGRNVQAKSVLGIRSLTREDIARLPEHRDNVPVIQRLRDPHHNLARLIATGMIQREAAQQAGYSSARAVQLMADPAFQNLVAEYRKMVTSQFVESVDEFARSAISNMAKAERQIAEHLDKADEEGELLPIKYLTTISSDRMDRFGYGKRSTQTNVNVDFASVLEKAVARSNKVRESGGPRQIEGSVGSASVSQPAPRPSEGFVAPPPLRRRA